MSNSSPKAVLKRHRTEVENPRFSATGTGFLLHVPVAEKSSGHAFSLIRSLRILMRDLCRALVRNWRIQVYPHLQDCTTARKIMCVGTDGISRRLQQQNCSMEKHNTLTTITKSWRLIYTCTISTIIHQALRRLLWRHELQHLLAFLPHFGLKLGLVVKVASVLLKLPTAIVISNSLQTTVGSPCKCHPTVKHLQSFVKMHQTVTGKK